MPLSQHRLALAGILLVVLSISLLGQASAKAQASPSSSLPAVALKYEGTYQGQCWTFMKKVVLEATGASIGFDYRQGYFDAGAVEVSSSEAQPGDIIQIVDDADSSPDADYNGLHTAIVLENLHDGTFTVIDSNSNFDGMVRVRPGYNPAVAAARYGIDYHIYRITGVPGFAPKMPATEPAKPVAPLRAGDQAVVSAQGDCLNLRSGAGSSHSIIVCMPDKTVVTILGESLTNNGRVWQKVSTPFGEGWAASEFLAPVAASGSAAAPTRPLLPFRSYVPLVTTN